MRRGALRVFPCRWLLLYETDNSLEKAEPLGQAISLLGEEPRLAAAGFTVKRHDGSFGGYGMRFPSWFSFLAGPNLTALWNLHRPNDSPWQLTQGTPLAPLRYRFYQSAGDSTQGLGTSGRIRCKSVPLFR